MRVYYLSKNGGLVFIARYKQRPVKSEIERVQAEHDNLEHGYGIILLGELLEKSGKYTEVRSFNREHPIKIDEKTSYIPDIAYKSCNGKFQNFIEYERGFHTQNDFSIKCNKMTRATRNLYFVVTNKESLNKLRNQIDTWATKRKPNSLRGVKVKICTGIYFKDNCVNNEEAQWQIEYDFNKMDAEATVTPTFAIDGIIDNSSN